MDVAIVRWKIEKYDRYYFGQMKIDYIGTTVQIFSRCRYRLRPQSGDRKCQDETQAKVYEAVQEAKRRGKIE